MEVEVKHLIKRLCPTVWKILTSIVYLCKGKTKRTLEIPTLRLTI